MHASPHLESLWTRHIRADIARLSAALEHEAGVCVTVAAQGPEVAAVLVRDRRVVAAH